MSTTPQEAARQVAATELPPSLRQMAVDNGKGHAAAQIKGRSPYEGMKLAHADAVVWLYQSHGPTVDAIFQWLEQYLSMKRESVAYVGVVLWFVYMLIGGGAQFISNLIGFVYPCYASVGAIRTENQDDDTQWLIYWTTFASFFLLDAFSNSITSWFPFYFILKSAFLVYLWLPQTQGATWLYFGYVGPAFKWLEKNCINKYC